MELTGTRLIAADRDTVWKALNDPDILKASIPGCQELTGNSEEGFEATVKQKVGPVSATFKGKVQLSNVVAGVSYTISGEGKGGAAGFAKGGADVRLADAEGGTELTYDAKASVGGKLAQLGSRVIDGFAKKTADQFFDAFKQAVEGPGAAPEPAPGTPPAQPGPGANGAMASAAAIPPDPAPRPAPISATGSAVPPRPSPAAGPAPTTTAPSPNIFDRIKAWLFGLLGR